MSQKYERTTKLLKVGFRIYKIEKQILDENESKGSYLASSYDMNKVLKKCYRRSLLKVN